MTSEQFLDELETVFEKKPKPQQLVIYRDKLRRFSSEQLLELLNKVLEEVKYFPRVSEIYKAAEGMGYLAIDTTNCKLHRWQPTECNLCHGEGRLAIIWQARVEQRETGRVEIQELTQVLQYTKSLDPQNYTLKANEFRTIFRCQCLAGDAATIPKAWPKWSRSRNPIREVWI